MPQFVYRVPLLQYKMMRVFLLELFCLIMDFVHRALMDARLAFKLQVEEFNVQNHVLPAYILWIQLPKDVLNAGRLAQIA